MQARLRSSEEQGLVAGSHGCSYGCVALPKLLQLCVSVKYFAPCSLVLGASSTFWVRRPPYSVPGCRSATGRGGVCCHQNSSWQLPVALHQALLLHKLWFHGLGWTKLATTMPCAPAHQRTNCYPSAVPPTDICPTTTV